MKKILVLIVIISAFVTFEYSCKRAIDDTIDCLFEVAFVTVHADLDSVNSKLMHFQFVYNGGTEGVSLDHNINWDFGDGVTITADTIIDHEYANSGAYDAVANFTLHQDGGTCSSSSTKHIVIP